MTRNGETPERPSRSVEPDAVRGEVREATPGDLPELEVVRRQALEAGLEPAYDRSDFAALVARPDPDLREWLGSEEHLALLVETEATIVSFGVLDRREAAIEGLYTAPHYQGRGCASGLLERFERAARNGGRNTLEVASPAGAVGFFARFGFERTGSVTQRGLELVAMEKSLE